MGEQTTLPGMPEAGEPVGAGPVGARAAREEIELVSRSLEETVAEDHPVRAIWALLERLDLGGFYTAIRLAGAGGCVRGGSGALVYSPSEGTVCCNAGCASLGRPNSAPEHDSPSLLVNQAIGSVTDDHQRSDSNRSLPWTVTAQPSRDQGAQKVAMLKSGGV